MSQRYQRLCIRLVETSFFLDYDVFFSGSIERSVKKFSDSKNKASYVCRLGLASDAAGINIANIKNDPMKYLDLSRFEFSKTISSLIIRSGEKEVVSAGLAALISNMLSQNNGLLLHASGLLISGNMFVFLAPSGGGKSTILKCSKRGLAPHDDKIATRKTSHGWIAGGVPLFTNYGATGLPISAPLAGLLLIKKSNRTKLIPLNGRFVLPEIAKQVYEPTGHQEIRKAVSINLLELVAQVPVFRLHYKKGDDVSEYFAKNH